MGYVEGMDISGYGAGKAVTILADVKIGYEMVEPTLLCRHAECFHGFVPPPGVAFLLKQEPYDSGSM